MAGVRTSSSTSQRSSPTATAAWTKTSGSSSTSRRVRRVRRPSTSARSDTDHRVEPPSVRAKFSCSERRWLLRLRAARLSLRGRARPPRRAVAGRLPLGPSCPGGRGARGQRRHPPRAVCSRVRGWLYRSEIMDTISYDLAGDGPTVALLHSTVCDRRMWDPQWPVFLDAGYRLLRCDFRGFGETPVPAGPHNDADDVVAVMDKLGIGQVELIGSSHGGGVAQEIAARWPGRVNSLALVCASKAGHEPTDELRDFWEREEELVTAGDIAGAVDLNVALWLGPEADEPTRQRVRTMQRHAFDVQLAADEEYEPIEVAFELSAITAPSLIISGGKDLPDFRQMAAELAAQLPAARPVELAWAGHLPTLERPQESSELLLSFLGDS